MYYIDSQQKVLKELHKYLNVFTYHSTTSHAYAYLHAYLDCDCIFSGFHQTLLHIFSQVFKPYEQSAFNYDPGALEFQHARQIKQRQKVKRRSSLKTNAV